MSTGGAPRESARDGAHCIDDDGCCLPDCVYEVDNDCDPATARGEAGCSANGRSHPGWLLGCLLLMMVALRRRRQL